MPSIPSGIQCSLNPVVDALRRMLSAILVHRPICAVHSVERNDSLSEPAVRLDRVWNYTYTNQLDMQHYPALQR